MGEAGGAHEVTHLALELKRAEKETREVLVRAHVMSIYKSNIVYRYVCKYVVVVETKE